VYHKSLLKLSNDDVDILINSLLSNASKEMANNVSTTLKNYINNIELKIKNTTDNKLSKEEKIIKDVLLNK
jgi:hypothetical protein